jgi:hypothetical protein
MRQSPNNVTSRIWSKFVRQSLVSLEKAQAVTPRFFLPWSGDPRINIQETKGKAKSYQVKQVLLAIDKLESK